MAHILPIFIVDRPLSSVTTCNFKLCPYVRAHLIAGITRAINFSLFIHNMPLRGARRFTPWRFLRQIVNHVHPSDAYLEGRGYVQVPQSASQYHGTPLRRE